MMNKNIGNIESEISQNFFMRNIEYFSILILLMNLLGSVSLYLLKI